MDSSKDDTSDLAQRLASIEQDCQPCRFTGSASAFAIGSYVLYCTQSGYYAKRPYSRLIVRCVAAEDWWQAFEMPKKFIFLMGVAGCGKSTVGVELANQLGARFIDADNYHTVENRSKMAKGIPLSDSDRLPWLQQIAAIAKESDAQIVVIACSALKRTYRQILSESLEDDYMFIHLDVPRTELERRLQSRKGHFFNKSLLDSQLTTLEKLQDERNSIILDADQCVANIITQIMSLLNQR
ncbi:unnamed protein product [Anisakis simplex]|uniref:Gluconokinase n=1 Tax=Anisakis simplex TaxID=6269 RepID=A0A0M3JXU5_ANISI|nr:unnamed protein product [Anisakis simplex]